MRKLIGMEIKDGFSNGGQIPAYGNERPRAKFTGDIPICPNCQKPTTRSGGMSATTCMYFPPIYDEHGNNTNHDRNTKTQSFHCFECNKVYSIGGNSFAGYYYL